MRTHISKYKFVEIGKKRLIIKYGKARIERHARFEGLAKHITVTYQEIAEIARLYITAMSPGHQQMPRLPCMH